MTKRQYAPREQAQRAGTQSRLAFPGSSAGSVRNSYPIHKADRTAVRVPTSMTISAETFWVEDHFTVTSTSPGTFALSYVPRTNSEDITVNGVTLLPVTEWTRSGVTLTVDAGVWLGLTGTWDLLVQYEVAEAVARPVASTTPSPDYTVANSGALTLPRSVLATDLAVIAVSGNGTGVVPSGAWATWTKLFDGSPGSAYGQDEETVDVWVGTGVGTGTTVLLTPGGSGIGWGDNLGVLTVFTNYDGSAVTLRNSSRANWVPTGGPATAAASNVTAVVGDIAFSAVRALSDYPNNCNPSGVGTFTATGFTSTDTVTVDTSISGGHNGIGTATGVAAATSVGASFGIDYTVAGDGYVEAVNLAIAVA